MAAIAAAEFTDAPRECPKALLGALGAGMLIYGALLTIALPWSFIHFVNGPELQRLGPVARGGFGAIALVSLLILLRWCIVQSLAVCERLRERESTPIRNDGWPIVSILVPAYGEGENIDSALRSLISLDYPTYEVIVVDDGSVDDTYGKALRYAGSFEHGVVRVFRKPNGGKWSALNFGFAQARGEFILCIDADSRLGRDALMWLLPHLADPSVVGVSGQVTVRNRHNLLTRLQALEYIISNAGLRTAQSAHGSVLVVPGPIGLYRRSIFERIAEHNTSMPA